MNLNAASLNKILKICINVFIFTYSNYQKLKFPKKNHKCEKGMVIEIQTC